MKGINGILKNKNLNFDVMRKKNSMKKKKINDFTNVFFKSVGFLQAVFFYLKKLYCKSFLIPIEACPKKIKS